MWPRVVYEVTKSVEYAERLVSQLADWFDRDSQSKAKQAGVQA